MYFFVPMSKLRVCLTAEVVFTLYDGFSTPRGYIGTNVHFVHPFSGRCARDYHRLSARGIIFPFSLLTHTNAATSDIELGELLCDSLDDASGSTMLRFAISSNEVRVVDG